MLRGKQGMSNNPIYCCITIEFCQPWDHLKWIRFVKEQELGNMICMSNTFHVGNSRKDRAKWKRLYPEVADQIDSTPVFPERPAYGMARLVNMPHEFWMKEVELCRKLGLKIMSNIPMLAGSSQPAGANRPARDLILGDFLMCESTSMLSYGLTMERLNEINKKDKEAAGPYAGETANLRFEKPGNLDFQIMHDWFLNRFRGRARHMREMGVKNIISIEATMQMRLAMEVDTDIIMLELVPHEPARGLAAVRGAARAYGKSMWGVHTAMGYYRAPEDQWLPERLAIANNLFYAGGASIFSEPNMGLGHWGLCDGFFSIKASPPIILGEKEYRGVNDPIVVRGREVLSDHYRFTQFHRRPAKGPRVKMGFVLGNLDGYTGGDQEHVWGVKDGAFAAGDSERTWHHFGDVHESESWYVPPRKYYWQADPCKALKYGTPPAGQVDIVPAEAPFDVLKSYGCLVYLGWNTMTAAQYAKIVDYVKAGGCVFMSVPHLSTQPSKTGEPAIINRGDVSDLFGVKIKGKGPVNEDIMCRGQARNGKYAFPTGALYLESCQLADVKTTSGRVLARSRKGDTVFVENKCGRGYAYLLTAWEYPGNRLDAFITDVLRTIADGEQDDIRLAGRDVEYAVYDGTMPSGVKYSTVYIINKDVYGQPRFPTLEVKRSTIPLRIDGYTMRIAWVFDRIVVSPIDRFVRIDDAKKTGRGYVFTVTAKPGRHEFQVADPGTAIRSFRVNGSKCAVMTDRDGVASVACRLKKENVLSVEPVL